MTRALVIAFSVLAAPLMSGCLAYMYGGPGFTERTEITVPLDDTVLAAVARTEDEIALTLTDGRSVRQFSPFVLGGDICGSKGCVPAERIASVTLTEEQFNLGYATGEVLARGQAALLAPLVLPMVLNSSPGLQERMRNDPAAWLAEQWPPDALRDVAHPVCRYDPEAPPFDGETDAEAAQWVWENRYALHLRCLNAARPIVLAYLPEDRRADLYHVEMLDEYWDRARCERASFHKVVGDWFSPVHQTHPVYALIEGRVSTPEAHWRDFQALLAGTDWIDEPGPHAEAMCERYGGLADQSVWEARLAEVRRSSPAYRDHPVLFVGERRIEPDPACAQAKDVEACYRALFSRETEAEGAL